MFCSIGCCGKHIPSRISPATGNVCENSAKVSVNNERWDVLQESVSRSYFAKYSCDLWPHISVVIFSVPIAGSAERLARKPSGNDIDSTTPRASVKGSHVIPDWELVKVSVSLPLQQDSLAILVDFAGADGSPSQQSGREQSAASSGEQTKFSKYSHINLPSRKPDSRSISRPAKLFGRGLLARLRFRASGPLVEIHSRAHPLRPCVGKWLRAYLNICYNADMLKVMVVRLYPNREQERKFIEYLDVSRRVYNHFLEHRKKAYQRRKQSVHYNEQTAMLTKWRANNARVEAVPFSVTREALKRLNRAFQNFFRRCEEGAAKKGYPRFKARDRWHSFEQLQAGKYIRGNRIFVPKVGEVRGRNIRPIVTTQKSLRVLRRGSKWFAQILYDDGMVAAEPRTLASVVGIDMGLNSFATTSDGDKMPAPRFFRRLERKLARANRGVSRKKRGSRNRRKAIAKLQRVYAKIADSRSNFTHHLSKGCVDAYDLIAVEKLNIRGMVSGRFSKSILDAAWGQFLNRLRYKAESAGVTFVEVNPAGTSQECSQCHETVQKPLKVRVHDCPNCGLILDRDHNAARNILRRGIQSLSGSAGRARSRRKPKACGDSGCGVVETGNVGNEVIHF